MTLAHATVVRIPGVLSAYAAGAMQVTVAAPTVRLALVEMERLFPTLHRNICDETGAVRRHINVFVNSDNVRDRSEGIDTPLAAGDVVTILPAVSGG